MKRIAEALVECGYADSWSQQVNGQVPEIVRHTYKIPVLPFNDTLEGRRQADALEDWLKSCHGELWDDSETVLPSGKGSHSLRLDRIKWCFKQLEKEDEP